MQKYYQGCLLYICVNSVDHARKIYPPSAAPCCSSPQLPTVPAHCVAEQLAAHHVKTSTDMGQEPTCALDHGSGTQADAFAIHDGI